MSPWDTMIDFRFITIHTAYRRAGTARCLLTWQLGNRVTFNTESVHLKLTTLCSSHFKKPPNRCESVQGWADGRSGRENSPSPTGGARGLSGWSFDSRFSLWAWSRGCEVGPLPAPPHSAGSQPVPLRPSPHCTFSLKSLKRKHTPSVRAAKDENAHRRGQLFGAEQKEPGAKKGRRSGTARPRSPQFPRGRQRQRSLRRGSAAPPLCQFSS